ncbi:protein O-mannosyl-transferase TMTC1-like [Argiope bruennichi]|uniref:protein O-mannosyl-transferase TMTC1-like n=1 Tax=Argiope bruennichi TaxID=94029 RepID=UPI002494A509|nr:protein O-mannosyl-transferase TMTC1-like [Argiope bruennichi]
MKMGRDIWMNSPSYQATSTTSCLYPSSSHPRYRKRDSLDTRRTQNASKSKSTHRRTSPRSLALWSQLMNLTSRVRNQSVMTIIMDTFVYLVVIVACIACYANSLDGEFVHDDLVSITMNPDVIGENPVSEIFFNDFWGKPMSDPSSHKSYRPFTVLTFRLNHVFCGLSSWSYHFVNVCLHSCVSLLVTFLCLEVLKWSREDCLIAALIFATHPIHTEAVSSAVGRAEVLSALFFLSSLLAFIKSTKAGDQNEKWILWFIFSLFCSGIALLAKEQGITVLAVCIAWRTLQLLGTTRLESPKLLIKKGLFLLTDPILWTTALMFLMLMVFRIWMLQGSMPIFSEEDNPASFSSSLLTRFYMYSYLAAFNFWMLLNPSTLSYDWQMGSIPLVTSVFDVRNVASLLLFLFLSVSALQLLCAPSLKKADANTMLLYLCILVLPFLPASNVFVTVGFVVAERVLYIPSIGFCILITYGLRKLRNSTRFYWVWKSCTIILIVLFMARTVIRNKDWKSREALFTSGLTSVPHNAKVHYNFANLQKDLGNVETAVEHYRMALSLWPNHASAHNNLGTLLSDTKEAEHHFKLALLINSHHPRALFNLASLYSKQGRKQVSQELLQRAIELDKEFIEAYSSLATIYAEAGKLDEAESLHLKALSMDPNNADSFNNYGTFLQKTGRVEEAVQQYRQAMRLQPNHTVAIVNAARSLRALKNNREAEELYKRALSINSEPKIMDNLGVLYISAGRIAEANKLYKDLYEKYTDYVEGRVHFAQVLMQERSFQQAETLLQSVIKENNTHRDALHQLSLLYSQVNRTTEALEHILKSLNLCSSSEVSCAQLHADHGDILKDLKQWDDAAHSYRMAIQLDPKLSHAHVNLAVINHLQGECHQALRHYHEAYMLDPDNQLLHENMRKLKLHLVDGSGTCDTERRATCKSR